MLSRHRSSQAADALRLLPALNTDCCVLLQVLGMEHIGRSEFCNSLTLSNDALIVSELNAPPALTHAARVSMSEQAMQSLMMCTSKQSEDTSQ